MKDKRQSLILSIIKNEDVETQEYLRDRLEDEGFNVTQATVSRDISELGLVKSVAEDGMSIYVMPFKACKTIYDDIFKQAVIRYENVNNMVVIKCRAGLANAACASLDEMEQEKIAGTVAGDDTIFVLFRTEKDAISFIKSLKKQLS